MLLHFAVMGNPIRHSLSPQIHQLFAQQTGRRLIYEKILIDEANFEFQVLDFFQNGGKGLNITLPCKERAYQLSAKQTARCTLAKAANTLWQQESQLHADNTDGVGLVRDLQRLIDLRGKKILILGSGGAARGVLRALLAEMPASLTVTNRTMEKAHALLREYSHIHICSLQSINEDYDVIINATSASVTGFNLPLPDALMITKPFCYDLAYNIQGVTPFVSWAKHHGAQAEDGLGMLVQQAAEAFYIWHGVRPDPNLTLSQMQLLKS